MATRGLKMKTQNVKEKKKKKVKTNKKIIPSSPAMQCVWVQASFFPWQILIMIVQ